jgi:hypothetical protein
MIDSRIENLGGNGGGGFLGGGGGGGWAAGILGLIALLSLFRNNFGQGNFDAANGNLNELQNQLGNVRADIGQARFDTVQSSLNQMSTLLSAISSGRLENIQALLSQTNQLSGMLNGVSRDVLTSEGNLTGQISQNRFDTLSGQFGLSRQLDANAAAAAKCCCDTQNMIQSVGYQGQIAALNTQNQLSNQIAQCCCDNKLAVQSMGYQNQLNNQQQTTDMQMAFANTNYRISDTANLTQYRDLENRAHTDRQLAEIKCLITDTAKQQEIDRLRHENERNFLVREFERSTNAAVGATVSSWGAARGFFGPAYSQPPYPFSQPY